MEEGGNLEEAIQKVQERLAQGATASDGEGDEEGSLKPDVVRYRYTRQQLIDEGIIEEEPRFSFTCEKCGLEYVNAFVSECTFCKREKEEKEEQEPSPLMDQMRAEEEQALICSGYPTQVEDDDDYGNCYVPSEADRKQWEWATSFNPKVSKAVRSPMKCPYEADGEVSDLPKGHCGSHWMVLGVKIPLRSAPNTEADKERDERLKRMREGIIRIGPM